MILIGDIHARFGELAEKLDRFNIRGETLIQVGDFGVGFIRPLEQEQAVLERLDTQIGESGCKLYAIRGNHDDPAYFGPSCPLALANITLLEDYSVLEVEDKRLLLVGGATSIDRRVRTEGRNYWRDEVFNLDLEKLDRLDLTDLWAVVTHTAPTFVEPSRFDALVLSFLAREPALKKELIEEREAVDRLYEAITARAQPRYWFYGHFHFSANTPVGSTQFILLDVMELYGVPMNDG